MTPSLFADDMSAVSDDDAGSDVSDDEEEEEKEEEMTIVQAGLDGQGPATEPATALPTSPAATRRSRWWVGAGEQRPCPPAAVLSR
jgi:hypothetical protein